MKSLPTSIPRLFPKPESKGTWTNQDDSWFMMAHVYLCWWRLRTYEGRMYFVHPGRWHELREMTGQWVCLDILFEEEPEMAAYIVGMGHISDTVSWWPPTWHTGSQQWEPPNPERSARQGFVALAPICSNQLLIANPCAWEL